MGHGPEIPSESVIESKRNHTSHWLMGDFTPNRWFNLFHPMKSWLMRKQKFLSAISGILCIEARTKWNIPSEWRWFHHPGTTQFSHFQSQYVWVGGRSASIPNAAVFPNMNLNKYEFEHAQQPSPTYSKSFPLPPQEGPLPIINEAVTPYKGPYYK